MCVRNSPTFLNCRRAKYVFMTEYMGGGFGAKFGAGNPGVVATRLSQKANAPVWLMLDRKEEHLSVGNRPDSDQTLKIAAKKDGTLTAMQLVSYGTAGTGTGAGAARARCRIMYECPNKWTRGIRRVHKRRAGCVVSRARASAGLFALEQAVDELAEKLGMDPLDLRDKIDTNPQRRVERRLGREKFGWAERRKPNSDAGPIKRGIGVAQAVWYRIVNMNAAVEVRLSKDGSLELMSAVQDIGTGIENRPGAGSGGRI